MSLSVYDHVRSVDTDCPPGIYRVVGVSEGAVILLRVGNEDGRRVHTGELREVDPATAERFEAAPNPDGNKPAGERISGAIEMVYWSVNAFLRQLVANPLPATVALALVALGAVGDQFLDLPGIAFTVFAVAGGLGLALVGSGRF